MGWKDFEWDCYNYLCDKYGSERVRFMKLGESDSTQSDIFVSILEERNFYIFHKYYFRLFALYNSCHIKK